MGAATNAEVQTFCDSYVRPGAAKFRDLDNFVTAFQQEIGDVYQNVTASNPPSTFVDTRTDNPPHLLAPADILCANTITFVWQKIKAGTATLADIQSFSTNWNLFMEACASPPASGG